jgi:glutamate-1-semialdehyde 2,1-aminomutase
MDNSVSKRLFQEAREVIAGGVNSPVRAFKAVHSFPRFIKSAQGARITDADDHEYIDYVLSWGPMILGHSHPQVVQAIREAAEKGASYGAPTRGETTMGELIKEAFPSMELLRMVSSGTEATMSAIRLARGYTGRDYVVKFAGGYHGHVDSLLVQPGSGAAALGIPGSPGIPSALAGLTLSLPFNDPEIFRETLNQYGDVIACVIVEPVPGNMGVVLPEPSFLEDIRALTEKRGIILIFDEVITGFRLTYGGYQTLTGITPDLTCLGKIIGGGLPVGAFGGRKEIMSRLAPDGPVYQAGTLSGNPLAMAAGCATLGILRNSGNEYERLSAVTEDLCRFIRESFAAAGIPVTINQIGSMFTIFFSPDRVTDLSSAQKSDASQFIRFFTAMLEEGIYMAPSPLEASFLSFAHTESDIGKTRESIVNALKKM